MVVLLFGIHLYISKKFNMQNNENIKIEKIRLQKMYEGILKNRSELRNIIEAKKTRLLLIVIEIGRSLS